MGFFKTRPEPGPRPNPVSLNVKLQKKPTYIHIYIYIYITTLILKLISLISLSTQPPLLPHPHWLSLSLSFHPPLMVSPNHPHPHSIHSPTHPHPRGGAQISWWLPFVTEEHGIVRSERDVVLLLDQSIGLLDRREMWWSEELLVMLRSGEAQGWDWWLKPLPMEL